MPEKKIKLLDLIRISFIIFLISLAAAIAVFQAISYYHSFNSSSIKVRSEYIKKQKRLIKREVEHVVEIIEYEKDKIKAEAKQEIEHRINEALEIAENIYIRYKGERKDAEIKKMIVNTLKPVRFDNDKNMYFIKDADGVPILNMEPRYRDLNFKKTGNAEQSVFRIFRPFNWYIGTAVSPAAIRKNTQEQLKKYIGKIRFGPDKNGYIFVNSYNGDCLVLSTQKELEGTNIWNITDTNGVKVVQEERKAAAKPGGDFIYYTWNKPSTRKPSPKVSFIRGIDDWKWIIGAGVYLDDVEKNITALHDRSIIKLKHDFLRIAVITGLLILLFLFLFHLISRMIQSDLFLFISFFKQAAVSDKEIDQSKIKYDEFARMADYANKMLKDKMKVYRELVEEKEQLAVTLRSIGDAVIVSGISGNILLMNRVAEKLTGWKQNEAAGKPLVNVFNIINEYSKKPAENPVKRVLKNGKIANLANHTVLIAKNGKEYCIEDSAAPILDSKNNIRGVVLVFRDVTEKLKKEKEILKIKKLESIGILAGGIAHDFNNLLTAVYGNISLARINVKPEEKAYAYLEIAEESLQRATNLTKQLLTFAKGGEPVLGAVKIEIIIGKTAEFILTGSNVKLHLDTEPELWHVNADKGQISQVISNLVINAKQAMPDGGNLYIHTSNTEICIKSNIKTVSPGRYVKITIRDEGTGIPKKDLERIFDPYFSTKESGSGLGLATVHSIIQKHDGYIYVDSILNRGTTFTIYLPALTPEEKEQSRLYKNKETVSNNDSAKILVVDDEEEIRKVAGKMLEIIGHTVEFAGNSREAVDKYKNALGKGSAFDIVIMDLTMPGGLGGRETAKEILKADPDAKIIVSSGYSTEQVMGNYREFGFIGMVAKPYRLIEMKNEVQRVLQIRNNE